MAATHAQGPPGRGPLAGLRVVDLSERSVVAALAGMFLADYGATVICVEQPGGDDLRLIDASAVWYRGKQSVVAGGPDGLTDEQLTSLCRSADVVLDTDRAYGDKVFRYPPAPESQQIYCLVTAEPVAAIDVAAGRRPGQPVYGEIAEARYGFMFIQDGHRDKPIYLGFPHAAFATAWLTLTGIFAALLSRFGSGAGQVVTTSLVDGLAALNTHRWLGGGDPPLEPWPPYSSLQRLGESTMVIALLQCADGNWVQINTGARGAPNKFLRAIGRDDLVDQIYDDDPAAPFRTKADCDSLWAYMPGAFRQKAAREWVEELAPLDVSIVEVLPPGGILHTPHAAEQGMARRTGQRVEFGCGAAFAQSPAQPGTETPAPGAHTASYRHARPARSGWLPATPSRAGSGPGPLAGVTVIDVGVHIAGPFASRLLADLGARVIKVSEKGAWVGRTVIGSSIGINRGKEGIALDLKSPAGREIMLRLVARADAVQHNMRHGVFERLNLGYDALSEANPALVYCHASGYGDHGRWASLPAWGPMIDGVSGMLARTGGEGNSPMHYATHVDYGGGCNNAPLLLAGLLHRARTGEGQAVETPQLGAAMFAMSDVYFVDGELHESFNLDRMQRGHAASNCLYVTDDGWLVLSCYSEREWTAAHEAFGLAAPESFAKTRLRKPTEVDDGELAGAIRALSTAEALQRLGRAGVACAEPDAVPAALPEVLLGGELERLDMMIQYEHESVGPVFEVGHMVRFSRTPIRHTNPSPALGEDTGRILGELGYDDAQIAELLESGAAAQLEYPRYGAG